MPEKNRSRRARTGPSRASPGTARTAAQSRNRARAQKGNRGARHPPVLPAHPERIPSEGSTAYATPEGTAGSEPAADRSTDPRSTATWTEPAGYRANERMQPCIVDCLDCHSTCLETIIRGLQRGGPHAEAAPIRLLLDCADICRTSADFMLRGSGWHTRLCVICAEVCDRCAESCERLDDDVQMKACAAACRRCAESCRGLIAPVSA